MIERELFRRYPQLRGSVPWLPLAQLPTPLQTIDIELPAGAAGIWIKRDDLAGDPYGGNKVRKLEFLLADAKARGATRVITAGAFGSHHSLATTVYARQMGLDVTVVLFPQHITPHVRRILYMMAGLGAEIRLTRRMEFVPVALQRARRRCGGAAYVIKPGGSDALGTLGYVECGLELAEQWRQGLAPRPARIHVAAGTLGTTGGLALGLAMAGENIPVIGTRITSRLVTNERALAALVKGAAGLLARAGVATPAVGDVIAGVTFLHDQIGEGYGRQTAAGASAVRWFGEAGIALDATYTAKSAAAFLADPLTAVGETLFLHTLSAVEPTAAAEKVTHRDLPAQIAAYITDAPND
ncbi:MAG: pyridoxal-phosphate dependent enzyme, partial [Longimicrobiales bacterium]